MSDTVICERRGPVLVITLNRPNVRNCLDNDTTDALVNAFAELGSDSSLGAAVLTGAGVGFCAGLDLKALSKDGPPRQLRALLRGRAPKPMIAAIEGFALAGGFELALTCDLIVAAADTRFALPEATRGLLATGGALFRLPQRLALEMILAGSPITATDAYRHGLITRLTDPGSALASAIDLADCIGRNAPLPVQHARGLIYAATGRPDDEMWDVQLPARDLIFGSNDAAEGAAAFLEKRSPQWTGT
jgi:enoyl-CoA hydratase